MIAALVAIASGRADAPGTLPERPPFVGAAAIARSGAAGAAACDRTLTVRAARRLARMRSTHGGRAVERFVNAMRPGQTACLRRGIYRGDVAIWRSGVTLRSWPGERVRIVGRIWIKRRARDVELHALELDGRNRARLPSPTVNGDGARFVGVDVTTRNAGICFIIGSTRYGRAVGTAIEGSRIHHCGRLPARNTEHGIYVAEADDTLIAGNVIHDNADRGIQLYPNAQRTVIERNVIDRNGQGIIFSGADGHASSGNVVRNNVISNARIRADVESWYPVGNPRGVGNVVVRNCVFGGRTGTIDLSGGGFVAIDNVVADPGYADPAAGDYRLAPTSPCAPVLAGA